MAFLSSSRVDIGFREAFEAYVGSRALSTQLFSRYSGKPTAHA